MPEPIIRFCLLALQFDAPALQADLAQIKPEDWLSHFNADYHDGGWSGVALRAVGGESARLYPDPVPAAPYADTACLARCPNIREALARLRCPLQAVRLLRLAPGGHIREHRDYGLCFEDGVARLHVPLRSNQAVEFYLDGQRVDMRPGECWYLNFNLPHRVQNHGTDDRIHLVIDCLVDDWLRAQMPSPRELQAQQQAPRLLAAQEASSQRQLEHFRELVWNDAALQAVLQGTGDAEALAAAVLREAGSRGYRFGLEDVRAALRAGRSGWQARWVVR
jgi:hypothetical protein